MSTVASRFAGSRISPISRLGRWPALARAGYLLALQAACSWTAADGTHTRPGARQRRTGLEIVGVPTLLQELDDLADLLVMLLGTDQEHIVSLHDNRDPIRPIVTTSRSGL